MITGGHPSYGLKNILRHNMKPLRLLTLCFILLGALVCPAHGRELLSTETTCTTADVTVTTTDEKVIATQVAPVPQGNTFLVRIKVYGTITTSANTTAYIVAARRDSLTGTVLGDQIQELVKVAAGGVEAFYGEFAEERSGQFSAFTYVSTIDLVGASANSTVSQNCITVDILQ